MKASEFKDTAINGFIAIIQEGVKRNNGHIVLKPVNNGTARCHNDAWDLKITDVYDYRHSRKDSLDKSKCGIYFSQSGCYDSPIETLDFNALYSIASQCE